MVTQYRNLRTATRTRFLFFFQAEDGIRDYKVTGVQTCALPISVFAGRDVEAVVIIESRAGRGEPRADSRSIAQQQIDATLTELRRTRNGLRLQDRKSVV